MNNQETQGTTNDVDPASVDRVVMQFFDKTGREIKAGDLLKVPHFTAYNKRKIFMYKLVVRVDDMLQVKPHGDYLYAVDVVDIARQVSLQRAHKCPLSVVGECEIIDDAGSGSDVSFWERKRVRVESA